ncbi:MAG: putative Ig domain-containing protein [Candidatus Sulfotelmatobacter sp.]
MRHFRFAPLLLLLFAFPCLASTIAITTTTLPDGTVDVPFSAVLNASGGCTPYHWALVSGSLPKGVSMRASGNTESLDLTGTPTAAGTDSFRVSVTGCGGRVSEMSYELVVQATSIYVVDLSWNASTSSDVSGYNIYRAVYSNSTCGSFSKINSSLNPSTVYADSLIVDGTSYCYATTAVNLSNEESVRSNIASDVKVPAP